MFITFEGGDGSGKSTQIRLAAEWLEEQGYSVLLTREPGGTEIGEKIRALLLDPENKKMTDMTEMLLYAAARAQLAREVIGPALADDIVVICDRWADSSVVYQGEARGLGGAVKEVNAYAAGRFFYPDVTILLDLDPDEALARTGGRHNKDNKERRDGCADRIEALGTEYQKKVREGYLKLAKDNPGRIHIIDASGKPGEVHERVRAALLKALRG